MGLSSELEKLLKGMDIEQGNGGWGDMKPGQDLLKADDYGDEDEDEDEDQDEEMSDEDEDEDEDDMDKSLSGRLRSDSYMAKSIDAAPVLDELIAGIDDLADDLRKSFDNQAAQQSVVNEALVKGLAKALQLIQQQADRTEQLVEQLTQAGARPVQRKAAQPGAQFLEKSLIAGEYNLPKEVVQQKLIKGIKQGVVGIDMAQVFDRDGAVPPHVLELIKSL